MESIGSNNIENTPQQPTPQMVIGEIMQHVALIGGNDAELPKLREILSLLNRGEYSAEQAIKKAQEVLSSKQDYH